MSVIGKPFQLGGGKLSIESTDAVLRVKTSASAKVTITRGSLIRKPSAVYAYDSTYSVYYFVIKQNMFSSSAWTVTAFYGGSVYNESVTINGPYEYYVGIGVT